MPLLGERLVGARSGIWVLVPFSCKPQATTNERRYNSASYYVIQPNCASLKCKVKMADTTSCEGKPRDDVCQSSDLPASILFLQHQEEVAACQSHQGDLQLNTARFNEQQLSQ